MAPTLPAASRTRSAGKRWSISTGLIAAEAGAERA